MNEYDRVPLAAFFMMNMGRWHHRYDIAATFGWPLRLQIVTEHRLRNPPALPYDVIRIAECAKLAKTAKKEKERFPSSLGALGGLGDLGEGNGLTPKIV